MLKLMPINTLKGIMKEIWGTVFYWAGLFHLVRFWHNVTGKRLTIVGYHRIAAENADIDNVSLPYLFVTQDSFHRQLHFYKKHYRITTFAALSASLRQRKLPWNSLIITFDDGYRDIYELAYPILKAHDCPATVFVTVDKVRGHDHEPFWWDTGYYYLAQLKEGETNGDELKLGENERSIFEAFKRHPSNLFMQLNKKTTRENMELFERLGEQGRFDKSMVTEKNRMLNWNEIDQMRDIIELGSHTRTHPNLTKLENRERALEIEGSKHELELHCRKKIDAFSYPGGEYNSEVQENIQRAGYKYGVTSEVGVNDLREPFSLKRINIWEGTSRGKGTEYSEGWFAYLMAGKRLRVTSAWKG